MYVKFKDSTATYKCTEPVEQKMFRSGVPIGWAIMFHIHCNSDSSQVDKIITSETISELEFGREDENNATFIITGYSVISACTIRHKSATDVIELQFTKASVYGEIDGGISKDG